MTKFPTRKDSGYRRVVGELRRLIGSLERIEATRGKKQDETSEYFSISNDRSVAIESAGQDRTLL